MLLLDVGNTRIKAARAGAGGLQALPTVAHAAEPAAALARLDAHYREGEPVWISQVLGAAGEAALGDALRARWGVTACYARSTATALGLRNAYREPERLGVDRWLALLAAWSARPGVPALVVDAGTALTADAVDADGRHCGGFIAAGLLTSQRAVLGATRFATRDLGAAYPAGFGTDTEACVRAGALLSCAGAIDRAAALAAPQADRWITGGDAEALLPALAPGWVHRPLLVLEGLWALARASAVAPG